MHHHTDRITHTTVFVTPVVEHWLEREIAQWVHPMKDRSDDPSHHERTLLPRSYISLIDEEKMKKIHLVISSDQTKGRHGTRLSPNPAQNFDSIDGKNNKKKTKKNADKKRLNCSRKVTVIEQVCPILSRSNPFS